MSAESPKAFLETVTSDISLQEKLKAAKSPDEAGRIGIERDHEFSADGFNQLNNEEPEGVAGARVIAQQTQSFGATNTCYKNATQDIQDTPDKCATTFTKAKTNQTTPHSVNIKTKTP